MAKQPAPELEILHKCAAHVDDETLNVDPILELGEQLVEKYLNDFQQAIVRLLRQCAMFEDEMPDELTATNKGGVALQRVAVTVTKNGKNLPNTQQAIEMVDETRKSILDHLRKEYQKRLGQVLGAIEKKGEAGKMQMANAALKKEGDAKKRVIGFLRKLLEMHANCTAIAKNLVGDLREVQEALAAAGEEKPSTWKDLPLVSINGEPKNKPATDSAEHSSKKSLPDWLPRWAKKLLGGG